MKAEPRMPIRDPDLRDAVLEHEVRPGDSLWGQLAELQRRRDAGADARTSTGGSIVTADELRRRHPEAGRKIEEEARAEERERIRRIEEVARPGCEDLIRRAKYERTEMTAEKIGERRKEVREEIERLEDPFGCSARTTGAADGWRDDFSRAEGLSG